MSIICHTAAIMLSFLHHVTWQAMICQTADILLTFLHYVTCQSSVIQLLLCFHSYSMSHVKPLSDSWYYTYILTSRHLAMICQTADIVLRFLQYVTCQSSVIQLLLCFNSYIMSHVKPLSDSWYCWYYTYILTSRHLAMICQLDSWYCTYILTLRHRSIIS